MSTTQTDTSFLWFHCGHTSDSQTQGVPSVPCLSNPWCWVKELRFSIRESQMQLPALSFTCCVFLSTPSIALNFRLFICKMCSIIKWPGILLEGFNFQVTKAWWWWWWWRWWCCCWWRRQWWRKPSSQCLDLTYVTDETFNYFLLSVCKIEFETWLYDG